MKLQINNQERETAAQNLQELATELQLPAKGVAVAVNNQLVLRGQWPTRLLQENDHVVIIKAACGG
jgi:sulfur carrier protein